MSFFGNVDFGTQVALGLVPGWAAVNKFGETVNADNGVLTDLWDGADGTTSTAIWVAPTQARIHDIASTSTDDDGSPVGTGMRTIRVFGLTDWDTKETSEDITLDGTTDVPTTNSYVIIHRMIGLTFGSTGSNVGVITATAQTDTTVTAAILATRGQTAMAIYGVPSTQKFALTEITVDLLRATGAAVQVDGELTVKENADQSDAGFIDKADFGLVHNAPFTELIFPPRIFLGPCIIKLECTSDTNDAQVAGELDGFLVDN